MLISKLFNTKFNSIFFRVIALSLSLASCSFNPKRFTDNNGPGNWGGRLSSIVASPADPTGNTLLVSSPGGGIWLTTNNGTTWTPVNNGLTDYNVLTLKWDAFTPGRLFALTYSGLFASTNLGTTWIKLAGSSTPVPLPPTSVSLPIIDPADPMPFAQLQLTNTTGVTFFALPCSGFYYSTDGTNFTQSWPFQGNASNPDNCIVSIAADNNTQMVYFSTLGQGITTFNSSPSGQNAHIFSCQYPFTTTSSWNYVNNGTPNSTIVTRIAYGGVANNLAILVYNINTNSNQVYTTTDGTNWNASTTFQGPNYDARELLFYASSNELLVGSVWPYYYSNAGNSWMYIQNPVSSFSPDGCLHMDTRSFYCANGNMWLTTDGNGGNYTNIAKYQYAPGSNTPPVFSMTIPVAGIEASQAYYHSVASVTGGVTRRYLGLEDNGGFYSDNDGANWAVTGAVGAGDCASMVFATSAPNVAYAEGDQVNPFVTQNALASPESNVTWTSLSSSISASTPWCNAMISVDPTDPNRVCFSQTFNIGISTDGGINVTNSLLPAYATLPANSFLPGNANPVCVYLDNSKNIYAGTLDAGVFMSPDNGTTWTQFALNTNPPRAVFNIVKTTADGGTFYIATTSGLYRQVAGGAFTLINATPFFPLTNICSDVVVDPQSPLVIYASYGYAGNTMQQPGGILCSIDNGRNFYSITQGSVLSNASIASISFDPNGISAGNPTVTPTTNGNLSRYLYIAVYGMGAWTYDCQGSILVN